MRRLIIDKSAVLAHIHSLTKRTRLLAIDVTEEYAAPIGHDRYGLDVGEAVFLTFVTSAKEPSVYVALDVEVAAFLGASLLAVASGMQSAIPISRPVREDSPVMVIRRAS